MPHSILRLDASILGTASVSRDLTDRIVARFPDASVTTRDLSQGLPLIDGAWVAANFTPDADRTPEQRALLALSDTLIAELRAADTIVIGAPVYNFGVPAALKAWVDLIARAGLTFRYTDAGPQGLITGKRAIIAMSSKGTAEGSAIDFNTTYLRHILGFIGITDVTIISADSIARDADAALQSAHVRIASLPVAA